MKLGPSALQSSRALDHLRKRLGHMHYSCSTAQVYVHGLRLFIPLYRVVKLPRSLEARPARWKPLSVNLEGDFTDHG
jgi:hypothetical protein